MFRATGAEELALLDDFLGDVGTPDDHVILASAIAESASRDSGRSNKQDERRIIARLSLVVAKTADRV
jgi:hypothetical protein